MIQDDIVEISTENDAESPDFIEDENDTVSVSNIHHAKL